MTVKNIHVLPDSKALIDTAARRWMALAREAFSLRGTFHVAMSGGSTPAALYRRIGEEACSSGLDWPRVHIWFGDERCVGPDHADSNYRMARETLLQNVPLRPEHVHRMRGEAEDPREAARDYADALNGIGGLVEGFPVLDLVLLGIGTDGHIASLFPGSANLQECELSVSAALIDAQKGWRISITLPVIRHARHVMLLASGEGKADILSYVLRESSDASRFPASHICDLPQLEWFLDAPAAVGLVDIL